MPLHLTVGDVVETPSVVAHIGDMQATFATPGRGKHRPKFVLLYLGTTDSPADVEKRLNALGWFFKEDEND